MTMDLSRRSFGKILGGADAGGLASISVATLPESAWRPKLGRVFANDSITVERLDRDFRRGGVDRLHVNDFGLQQFICC